MFEPVATSPDQPRFRLILFSVTAHAVVVLALLNLRKPAPAPIHYHSTIVPLRWTAEAPVKASPPVPPPPKPTMERQTLRPASLPVSGKPVPPPRPVQLDTDLPDLLVTVAAPMPPALSRIAVARPIVVGAFAGASLDSVAGPAGIRGETCSTCGGLLAAATTATPVSAARPPTPSGFGEARTESLKPVSAEPSRARTQPVIVEFKPRPDYSDEARKRKLEGEVVIQVLFPASGPAQPLRLVEGLGYGLDEAALRAVPEIRFRPAEREGKPVEQVATVHFIFRLAY
jgi:periplasmic protein TonB